MQKILFLDLEIDSKTEELQAYGLVFGDEKAQGRNIYLLNKLIVQAPIICGHNLICFDLPYLQKIPGLQLQDDFLTIDTLLLSVLLRPDQKRHKLEKDYLLSLSAKNDPLLDALNCKDLFHDLIHCFEDLSADRQSIFLSLLRNQGGFDGFWKLVGERVPRLEQDLIADAIRKTFEGKLCTTVDLGKIITGGPIELAMVLSILDGKSPQLFTPSWLLHQYPRVSRVFTLLRNTSCRNPECEYCNKVLNHKLQLKTIFGYDNFRRFEGDLPNEAPLQERAVIAALQDESFIVLFPTGGGKSITFQLPALMRGISSNTLTVVISPLVSLMKDQVDNLKFKHDVVNSALLNGLLSPLERQETFDKVADGTVNLLFIAPESLRSNAILNLLQKRMIDRFVIDEAHCFSAWGHDFRVDFLYIAKFISNLEKLSKRPQPIPVSCFTATARPEVVEDIKKYFQERLKREMKVFETKQARKNLSYAALSTRNDEEKWNRLLELLESNSEPTIVYVSRIKTGEKLSESLKNRGFDAAIYHGKMERTQKTKIQEAFLSNQLRIIIATTAFGMGVDKDNVKMVIHYEISSSLENYVQEAGRAGRDQNLQAQCIILFNEDDLNKHFELLQSTKLNKKDIDQIWSGIKAFKSNKILKSALEIARKAGWEDDINDLETRVRAAINALEEVKYLERTQNSGRYISNSLGEKTLKKAQTIIWKNEEKFSAKQLEISDRVLQYLYGKDQIGLEYMSEALGLSIIELNEIFNVFKEIGVLGNGMDLSVKVPQVRSKKAGRQRLNNMIELERALISSLFHGEELCSQQINLRELNTNILNNDEHGKAKWSTPEIRTIMRYWSYHGLLQSSRSDRDDDWYLLNQKKHFSEIKYDLEMRSELGEMVIAELERIRPENESLDGIKVCKFSLIDLRKTIETENLFAKKYSLQNYERILLYLNDIEAIELLDGMIVMYNRMSIERKQMNNSKQFTKDDYKILEDFYRLKIEQIHIVGEYAKQLLKDYLRAIKFTNDYFQLDYKGFLKQYFNKKEEEIRRPMTKERFEKIFGELDIDQTAVVQEKADKVLVTAGPGSGKTRVLVHKMASLLLMEDVKHEQLLMLTFSRPAAQEFKTRLAALVPGIGRRVDIFTYHAYAFRLLGKLGDLHQANHVIPLATEAILEDNISKSKIAGKSVILLDEFQDISGEEWDFLQAIIQVAENPRIIAAGDDDQCIYEFRGASLEHMEKLQADGAIVKHLPRNYRAASNLVEFTNHFLRYLPANRLKAGKELIAKRSDLGNIKLVRYRNSGFLSGILDAIVNGNPQGSSVLLTGTNEEASKLYAALREKGMPAMLLSNQDGYKIGELREFRYFSKSLKEQISRKDDLRISAKEWQLCLDKLKEEFKRSTDLPFVLQAIHAFSDGKKGQFYHLDWEEYRKQLRIEDVMFPEKGQILVSTMHKSKGREFDNVYLLLDNFRTEKEEHIRTIYVALTRAKNNLEIHTNLSLFDAVEVPNFVTVSGFSKGVLPIIEFEAGLSHVNLNHFKSIDSHRNHLNSHPGMELVIDKEDSKNLLDSNGNVLIRFSGKMEKEIDKFRQMGYELSFAILEHIVYWYDSKTEKEFLVGLPLLRFKKT